MKTKAKQAGPPPKKAPKKKVTVIEALNSASNKARAKTSQSAVKEGLKSLFDRWKSVNSLPKAVANTARSRTRSTDSFKKPNEPPAISASQYSKSTSVFKPPVFCDSSADPIAPALPNGRTNHEMPSSEPTPTFALPEITNPRPIVSTSKFAAPVLPNGRTNHEMPSSEPTPTFALPVTTNPRPIVSTSKFAAPVLPDGTTNHEMPSSEPTPTFALPIVTNARPFLNRTTAFSPAAIVETLVSPKPNLAPFETPRQNVTAGEFILLETLNNAVSEEKTDAAVPRTTSSVEVKTEEPEKSLVGLKNLELQLLTSTTKVDFRKETRRRYKSMVNICAKFRRDLGSGMFNDVIQDVHAIEISTEELEAETLLRDKIKVFKEKQQAQFEKDKKTREDERKRKEKEKLKKVKKNKSKAKSKKQK